MAGLRWRMLKAIRLLVTTRRGIAGSRRAIDAQVDPGPRKTVSFLLDERARGTGDVLLLARAYRELLEIRELARGRLQGAGQADSAMFADHGDRLPRARRSRGARSSRRCRKSGRPASRRATPAGAQFEQLSRRSVLSMETSFRWRWPGGGRSARALAGDDVGPESKRLEVLRGGVGVGEHGGLCGRG